MEFTNHGRDRFYISEQDAANWRPSSSGPSSSSTSAPFRWNDGGGGGRGGGCFVEKELMFDKVVTPSDVGKLNRLVIPKQHAEKHFPLGAGASQSGLLLSFEDRNGESWCFRYSYWSSSQSYVMTKGWSRFVKEKRLGAGDTVSFARGVGESARDRLYIDWKRRPEIRRRDMPGFPLQYPGIVSFSRPWGGGHLFMPPPPPPPPPAMVYDHQFQAYGYNGGSQTTGQLMFFQSPATGQQLGQAQPGSTVLDSALAVDQCQVTASRGVRLFGVNLASDEEGTSLSLSRSQDSSILLLRPLQHSSVESSMASSSSTSKEQHSSLDLDL